MIEYRAPAKLNLTLEVLGRRPDGYHELRSVMTTVDLFDTVSVGAGRGVVVMAADDYDAAGLPSGNEENTVERALWLMMGRRMALAGQPGPDNPGMLLRLALERVGLRLEKRIPAAAGLGGGSSDGAAALRALNDFWSLGLSTGELCALAGEIGSDCPFFIDGGVQFSAGRGEQLTPLPAFASTWFCLLRPPVWKRDKTRSLYALLRDSHFTSGAQSEALAQSLHSGRLDSIPSALLGNVFDAVADEAFGSLAVYRDALRERGALTVHCCGAGPTLYGLFTAETACRAAEASLRAEGFEAWAVTAPAHRGA